MINIYRFAIIFIENSIIICIFAVAFWQAGCDMLCWNELINNNKDK